jgi:hypothetical protein
VREVRVGLRKWMGECGETGRLRFLSITGLNPQGIGVECAGAVQ